MVSARLLLYWWTGVDAESRDHVEYIIAARSERALRQRCRSYLVKPPKQRRSPPANDVNDEAFGHPGILFVRSLEEPGAVWKPAVLQT